MAPAIATTSVCITHQAPPLHTITPVQVTEGVTEAGSPEWEQQQAGMGVKWDARECSTTLDVRSRLPGCMATRDN